MIPPTRTPRPPAGAPRFNPWPYSLVAFFVVAITGIATLVTIAVTHRSELVATDYYDQEMRFQKRVDQVKRTQPWEGRIAVGYLAGSGVQIHLPREHAALGASGTASLYRPSAEDDDRSIQLALDADGGQVLPLRDLAGGLWKVRLQWKVADDEFFAERNLVVPSVGGTAH